MNAYIKQHAGEDFSARDFRTWHATVLAAVALAGTQHDGRRVGERASQNKAITAAVATVAGYLGNTPAVCRASYVDPRVIDRYREGSTISELPASRGRFGVRRRARIEGAVVDLLDESD